VSLAAGYDEAYWDRWYPDRDFDPYEDDREAPEDASLVACSACGTLDVDPDLGSCYHCRFMGRA
jgi:hypothetical protein